MLQGTQAERRPELHVDGGDVEVSEIWKWAERGEWKGAAAKETRRQGQAASQH